MKAQKIRINNKDNKNTKLNKLRQSKKKSKAMIPLKKKKKV